MNNILSANLSSTPTSARGMVIARLLNGDVSPLPATSDILYITTNDRELETMESSIRFFAPDTEILVFPAWDCMPYDRVSPKNVVMAKQIKILNHLANRNNSKDKPTKRVLLISVNAALQKLPPADMVVSAHFSIHKGNNLNQSELSNSLIKYGYRRSGKAMETGEFAFRGGIIDIIPSGMEQGIRIDMFGDEVEEIRLFDPMTQISSDSVAGIDIYPISEVLLNEENIARFRNNYRELFGAVSGKDPLYDAISEGMTYSGMEHWLPLFYENTQTIFDYCKDSLIISDDDVKTAIEERSETIIDYYEARKTADSISRKNNFAGEDKYNPPPPAQLFIMKDALNKLLSIRNHLNFSSFDSNVIINGNDNNISKESDKNNISLELRPVLRFTQGQVDNTPFHQLERQQAQGKPVIIACMSSGSRERVQTLLMENDFHTVRLDEWKSKKNIKGKTIGLCVLPIEKGFETEKFYIFSEQDIFGDRIVRKARKKKSSEVFMSEASNFNEGDLIVHKEHGIGRFEGLVAIEASGAVHDCLKLVYAGDDKLFLPVENIEIISKFGLDDEGINLDKLGGASWQNRKAKLKQRIKIAAEALLSIAAKRLIKKGKIFDASVNAYDSFCSGFPYVETDDQARAIAEVIDDLRSGKPMDRLVCGDVGFGKTEVALRAAFVTACNEEQKTQVAVICPTTLLARQHFRNFRERFSGFDVTVRQLSRMVSAKEQKDTKEKLAEGKVDIVIGTHALLAKSIKFKNLGLVIVDEEQHFGVGQKEKLKELKSEVHVLTLSATPIPRTLQMALTGVRDLSLITTPPIDRLAIRSFVMPFDLVIIREAIMREMHRAGRCFVVTPRIKYIAELKLKITELVPEARIVVAHGGLPASELDQIMNDFYDGKYDILISTAIIESGLDIPEANTIIVHNAHLFGLAQLYQMRGRVGRGKIRAYAYFMLPHHRELTKNSTKRLEVMQTLDTLGAGFSLASHDMDIRGFGNLVGEEQSGHIKEVGIELYQQMLEETVAALRAENQKNVENGDGEQDFTPVINLGISVLIPESYIDDLSLRLGLYRRAAGMQSDEEIEEFTAELIDRFGDVPEEVRHLITTLKLKLLCKKAGIERIDTGAKGAVISFYNNYVSNPEALIRHIELNPRRLKLRGDQKLVFTHEWKGIEDKIVSIRALLIEIINLF
ncbi:MAG: transcription-repair coupling factor [Rickettsiales bacterium]